MDDNLLDKNIKMNIDKIKKTKSMLYQNYGHEIIPNLYLSDLKYSLYNNLNFDIIINLSEYNYKPLNSNTKLYYYDIKDEVTSNIIDIILLTNEIILSGLKENKKILVHCQKGLSRSVSIIMGFLMVHHKVTFEEAEKIILSKRISLINGEERKYDISINIGFILQLKKIRI